MSLGRTVVPNRCREIFLAKLARRLLLAASRRRRRALAMNRRRAVTALLFCVLVANRASTGETPPVPPPGDASLVVRDTCANFWTISTDIEGRQRLLVLPAQAPHAWREAAIPGIAADGWQSILAEADGSVTVSNPRRSLRFDPRVPNPIAQEIAPGGAPTRRPARIFHTRIGLRVCLTLGASGAFAVALSSCGLKQNRQAVLT